MVLTTPYNEYLERKESKYIYFKLLILILRVMKKIKITVIVLFLSAFGTFIPCNAQAEHPELVFNIKCKYSTVFSRCLNETVEGILIYNEIIRRDKNGKLRGRHYNIKGGQLTGCKSGKVFHVIDTGNRTYISNDNNDQYVYNMTTTLLLVGKKGENYRTTWKGHMTKNANGDLIVNYWEMVDCD